VSNNKGGYMITREQTSLWVNDGVCPMCTLSHEGVGCATALRSKLLLLKEDMEEAVDEKYVVAQKQVEQEIKDCEQLIINLAA
jgi:2-methylaconitate cis-trans-isomerase PrpF